mmetsp:Transcript_33203/g.73397  ORF Transcript_33203/g.73397 Transcript_33203/m.73397 type:complete len:279 (-) Transcript_33203:146-982(-)|eukprot:CAMPEP_0202905502 /NCGR_PEP_ID=MMETSP1392-20130828/34568_1 /ASSEMBLY_ACC=CAM_ASM_000868 /TAXON_ID=225041 /ORGANISM="Chlamydomonas chlamydogama, Strain SAG 11-48b" /LENGTH=278 /DNA_ID=CAMNT_0049593605 /DNA_START=263 /DNA_END=1099 /DNA_ORIENTATION=-
MSSSASATNDANHYEQEREKRIQRNREMLQQLSLPKLMQEAMQVAASVSVSQARKRKMPSAPSALRGQVPAAVATRRSGRRQAALEREADGGDASCADEGEAEASEADELMSQQQYFKLMGLQLPEGHFHTDGNFKGWVNADVCCIYGIASSPNDLPPEEIAGKQAGKVGAKGSSSAKLKSSTQLHSYPNAYFYRHVAPHEKQAMGQWTQEEHELFVTTARKYGVGDSWGLFASHIPQRVGYQCSAYYTQVIIPSGEILDTRFRLTHTGKAVFKPSAN